MEAEHFELQQKMVWLDVKYLKITASFKKSDKFSIFSSKLLDNIWIQTFVLLRQ